MAQKKPIVDYLGKQSEIVLTDTIPPQNLATGVRDNTKFLRDDGTWQIVAATASTTDYTLTFLFMGG